jgi:hypothetical protein
MPFVKGDPRINRGGRPTNVISIKKLIRDNVDLTTMFEKINEGVKKGKYEWIKLTLEYLFGKPQQYIEQKSEVEVKSKLSEEIMNLRDDNESKD